jgi:Lar family restriction alleviation protein
MSELKPCPFCGNELPVHYIAMQNRYVQLISCPFCNATVSCNKFLSDKDALATWNNRPIEDALNARIAELEAFKKIVNDCGFDVVTDAAILEYPERKILTGHGVIYVPVEGA